MSPVISLLFLQVIAVFGEGDEGWAPQHGGNEGDVHLVSCLDGGNFVGIQVRTGGWIDQISFVCLSPDGTKSVVGPYGGNGGSDLVTEECPQGEIISSFHGKESDMFLEKIGINCRVPGAASATRRPAIGGNWGTEFDDEEFADGRNILEIRVHSGKFVFSIQTRYVAVQASECQVTDIIINDDNIHGEDSFEAFGKAIGLSCASGQHQLSLQSEATLENKVEVEVKDNLNFASTVWLSYDDGTKHFTQALEASEGSTSKFAFRSSQNEAKVSSKFTYEGPGSMLVIGGRRRSQINRGSLPVTYHFTCESGSMQPQDGSIKLDSNTFGLVYFAGVSFEFNDKEGCTEEVEQCLLHLDGNGLEGEEGSLKENFIACFPPALGTPEDFTG